ncbi:MAG: hypothetical protein AB7G11_06630 [Phycisphaerales bacterium]
MRRSADRTWRPVVVSALGSGERGAAPTPAAVLVLAGSLRPSPLASQCGRSVLDLPLSTEHTVLSKWVQWAAELSSGAASPEMRVIHDRQTPAPVAPIARSGINVVMEQESKEYRGPAGAAKDACERYAPSSTIILVEGARCLTCSLTGLVRAHAESGAVVTVGCNADRSPAGVYAIRRSALDLVPRGGFMDLKEQWLSRVVASGDEVRVCEFAGGRGMALRTLEQYLLAVSELNDWADASVLNDDGGAACDRMRRDHVVLGAGAVIDPEAVVLDSVVMPGAVVKAGAVVARSLVCERAVVGEGEQVVSEVIAGPVSSSVITVRPGAGTRAQR